MPTSQDEQAVSNILSSLTQFDAHSFDKNNSVFRSMHSGIPATPELIQDMTLALRERESTVETLLNESLVRKRNCLILFPEATDSTLKPSLL